MQKLPVGRKRSYLMYTLTGLKLKKSYYSCSRGARDNRRFPLQGRT